MRAILKIIGHIKNMSYIERLKDINLPALKCRRLRGYMIEICKIINEIYDKNVLLNIPRNDRENFICHSNEQKYHIHRVPKN